PGRDRAQGRHVRQRDPPPSAPHHRRGAALRGAGRSGEGPRHRGGGVRGVSRLSEEDIRMWLASGDLPGWRFDRGEIFKNYKFGTFMEAIAFINRIAEKAEAANHHPDLENHYNRVRVALHNWSENAVTDKDVSLAGEIASVSSSSGPGEVAPLIGNKPERRQDAPGS